MEQLPYDDPKRTAFRNDDRLVKTLLLAALVPEVESLRALNAERLAALNHGTIKTPIPGREGQEVLRRCRTWAARSARFASAKRRIRRSRFSSPASTPRASSSRRAGKTTRGTASAACGRCCSSNSASTGELEFEQSHDFLWRNTKRSCVVLFRNIRELPDASLENADDRWKLIIDFPFDEPGHGPRDDLSRCKRFDTRHPDGAKTLCWIPAFLQRRCPKGPGDAGHPGAHFDRRALCAIFANHLSPQDRQAAKSLLENQRSVLRQRVQNHLDAAYGLESLTPGSLDTTHELELHERFVSLWPGFEPQPPVAANLGGAMEHLLSQALEHEFPAAPYFEAEIKTSHLKKVYEQVRAATQTDDGRVAIDKPLRPLLRQIANPLHLGEMG